MEREGKFDHEQCAECGFSPLDMSDDEHDIGFTGAEESSAQRGIFGEEDSMRCRIGFSVIYISMYGEYLRRVAKRSTHM